jgi:demethylmenaquinone methyltransferase/2-methoxy-6-polyprenyl-1,4-benzoquinol methylase
MPSTHEHDDCVREQISYYRARAGEYDQWFYRQDRYDRGSRLNEQWFGEVQQLRDALDSFRPQGHLLELACGTGLWTELLVKYAERITAIDAVSELLELNRARVRSSKVDYLEADIFEWTPKETFDVVFFAFWLSHVPPEGFDRFWRVVGQALKDDGRVFFADSRYEPTSTAKDHRLENRTSTRVTRYLNDGREFRIVKIFYDPEKLTKRLDAMGWDIEVLETPKYFIYGSGRRR